VIKSTEVMLMKGGGQAMFSARNRFCGQVESVQKGEAMGLVTVKMGQFHLGAAITREAIDEMGLKQGDQVTAVVKATEVMFDEVNKLLSSTLRGPRKCPLFL